MNENHGQLKTEVNALQAEVDALETEADKLRQKRSSFRVAVSFPKDNSPEALAEFQQQNARETAKWAEELQEINQALNSLEVRLAQKQAELAPKQAQLQWQELEEGVQIGGKQLQDQVQKINQLSEQLAAEIIALKQIYQKVNPMYCQWLQKPVETVEFRAVTIPYVFADGERFVLGSKNIEGGGQG